MIKEIVKKLKNDYNTCLWGQPLKWVVKSQNS